MSIIRRILRKGKAGVNKVVRKSYWFQNEMFPDCEKFWRYNAFNTEVVNLGTTSAVRAFNYEGLNIKAANWALCHNPLIADYAILRNYYSFLRPQDATVIISLCPFSTLAGSYDYLADRYYTLLYPSSMPYFSYRRQQQVKAIRNNPFMYYPMWGLLRDVKHLLKPVNKHQSHSEEWFVQNAKMWIDSWLKEFSLKSFSEPLSLKNQDSIKDAIDILTKIIIFCKERYITPVILVPPMHHALAEQFTPEARKLLLSPVERLANEQGVAFHNYIDTPDISTNSYYFDNCFEMNPRGAKIFTKQVLKDLKLI